jgi:signal recognition particle subunit SRP54
MMAKIKKMGSFKKILSMLPGIPKEIREAEIDEKQVDRLNAIITSMTKKERKNPKILNASRRKRIASGSGNKVEDINRFMNQFEQMQKMMKKMTSGNGRKQALRNFKNINNNGNFKF